VPSDDLELAEQAATLGSFIAPLEGAGYDTELLQVSEQLEMPTLVVGLPSDEQGRGRWLSVNLVPFDLGETVGLSVAQVYAPMPFGLPAEHRDEFARFALAASQMLPVGSMGARDDGEVYFRYMASTPDTATMEPTLLASIAMLFQFQLDVFGAAMESVATGKATAADALAALEVED
jgi:hypothetical protein